MLNCEAPIDVVCFVVKAHWLKTDFDKWRDEDDSDAEEGQDMQLEEVSPWHVSAHADGRH